MSVTSRLEGSEVQNVAGLIVKVCLLATLATLCSCVPSHRQLPGELDEVSGVERIGSVTYMINDSGNPPQLYSLRAPSVDSFNRYGITHTQQLSLPNVDWEALTAYADGTLCLCDIGDNRRARSGVQFHFVSSEGIQRSITRVYPNAQSHNAEACFVMHQQLFVLTKNRAGLSPLGAQKKLPNLRVAYLYRVDTARQGATTMVLQDSLELKASVVTDAAVVQGTSSLAILSYNYGRLLGFLPFTRTYITQIRLSPQGTFDQSKRRQRRVRSPFTLTQYEAIVPSPVAFQDEDESEPITYEVDIFSERTLWLPARWRRVALPGAHR